MSKLFQILLITSVLTIVLSQEINTKQVEKVIKLNDKIVKEVGDDLKRDKRHFPLFG
jgi:hypothetical protein